MFISGKWCDCREPGFGLTSHDVPTVAARMIGVPVTYEHVGIFDAADNAYRAGGQILAEDVRRQLERNVGAARPVGNVVAADAKGRFIAKINPNLPLVTDAIKRRIFSVSLTHVGDTLVPLELSLVRDPARTAAAIRAQYKGDSLPFHKTLKLLAMADAPMTPVEQEVPKAPEVSPIEAALSLLGAEERSVLERQLRNYETQAQKQEAVLAELEAARTQDRDIATQLADDIMKRIREQGVDLPLGMPTDAASIHNSPNDLRRMLEACSRAFATKGSAAPAAPAAPEEVAAPAAPTEEPPTKRSRGRQGATDGDALMRAFMRKFD
jgi:hypothetical protein